jgi:glycosyltransferase involved in cell wall biosynthesis
MSEQSHSWRTSFFTICASNYLANAVVLGQSVSAAHGGSRLTVFLLDALPADVTAPDQVDIVTADTIMPIADWHHYQCFYSLLELATSIKPLCFKYLLTSDCAAAIYLDPDIVLFNPLNLVLSAIQAGHEIVLTPHILTPLPTDGKIPNDLAIMRAGIFNMGFGAFSNTARSLAIISWWERQLRTLGSADISTGLFTDQKWIDFAPVFSPTTYIIRDPSYNVAYWNLHERKLTRHDDGWRVTFVDGSQSDLTFFHFSGYSPTTDILSKHENRFGKRPPGDTRQLLARYSDLLVVSGLYALRERPIAAPRFDNGVAWDPICRMLYRGILSADPDFGDPLQGDAFLRVASGSEVGDHLPRYLRTILKQRADVAQAYDDGRNLSDFLTWLTNDGPTQLGVGMDLLSHLGIRGGDVKGVSGDVKGVNYVGYFRSHLGIAEASRNAVAALKSAKIDVALHDISHQAMSPTGTYAVDLGVSSHSRYGVTILGVNADETPRTIANLPSDLHSTFLIGCWAWETSEFLEEWCDRFDLVDEVWVASKYVAEAVRAKATVPVLVMPYAVLVPEVEPDKRWLTQICPDVALDEFIFICFFDVASIPFRKNPRGAIEAFKRAFRSHEPVRLIVKVLNGERDPDLLKSLVDENAGYRVTVWDAPLDSLDRFRLLASTDAFVSLHRAEGFGLVIAEAMALGRPVIVTDWSGNTDFTDSENAALVSYDLIKGKQSYGPYPAGTVWAEPNLDDAARQMRRVWEDLDWRSKIGAFAARTIATKFSSEIVGAAIKSRLERLSASTRTNTRIRKKSMQTAASLVPRITFVTAFRLASRDALSRPLFYAARAPRMLRLLFSEGGAAVLSRVALYARDRVIVRPKFLFRKIVLGFLSLFSKARLTKADGHKTEALNIVRRHDHDHS